MPAKVTRRERIMPVHAWTRVTAGTFHDFHNAWITELRNALNDGVLPAGYYALGEQRSGDVSPDVLTLHAETVPPRQTSETASDDTGMIAVTEQPPKVTLALEAATDAAFYIARRRTLVIYHATGDRIVALIEILSPGNKHSQHTVDDFLDKVIAALRQGYHVLVIDLFPPGHRDPSHARRSRGQTAARESGRPASVARVTLGRRETMKRSPNRI
jgi:Protein of unknown function (DUF4058)